MNSDSTFNDFNIEPLKFQELKQLQGQVRIQSYEPLKRNWYKTLLLMPLVAIATGLIVLVLMIKRKNISSHLMYSRCRMDEATHILIIGNDKSMEIVDHIEPFFFYRKLKYISRSSHPYPLSYKLPDSLYFQLPDQYKERGLGVEQVFKNRQLYGLCEHTIDVPTLPSYLAQQMFGIFFILQYITCAIYVLQNFIFFAVTLISMSLLSTIVNYFFLRSSFIKIKELAEHYTTVNVIRDGVRVELSSNEIVPGDIYEPRGVVPCDSILVQGQLYLNESSLTGESVPIAKTAVKTVDDSKNQTKWLFEGSVVLESRGKPLAMAVQTGYITRRGRIFRKIIYREPKQPEFYMTAVFFLFQILAYCTLIFLGSIPLFTDNQISSKLIILRFFDMVGWAVPPSLPIAFNVCYSFSLYRLRKQGIFGTEPYKTIISGKVTTVCFDKTGTLTENAMELHSIIKFEKGKAVTIKSIQKLFGGDILNKLMASCHTVRKVNDQFLGDQLDLRMFLYSEYHYQVPEDDPKVALYLTFDQERLQVIRINQFESKFQAMSVLVKDCSTNKYYIFVKGAPERIQKISLNQVDDFDNLLANISLAGLRCLAVAFREVTDFNSWQKCDRLSFEKDLTLIGLVTFDNKLKEDTVQTITNLREAEIQSKIITGDNIYIAVETAIRTGILSPNEQVLILRGDSQISKNSDIICELLSKDKNGKVDKRQIYIKTSKLQQQNRIAVAIDNNFMHFCSFIPRGTKIFARITPESKAQVVRKLIDAKKQQRKLKTRWDRFFGRTIEKIAMVGDGANDIMAIKEADLGIGISDTDSSFAANFSISQLLNVDYILRQGKSTLSIVIDMFRYYGAISVVKYLGNHIVIWDKASFNDNQFTYLNYGSTIEIMGFLCLSRPGPILSRFVPNDNVMGLHSRLVFLGNIIIPVVGLLVIAVITIEDSIYVASPNKVYDEWVFSCVLNTTIFLSSHLFYIWNTFWSFTSQPWTQPIYKNIVLFVWLIITITINSVLFFFTSSLTPFFMIVELPKRMEGIIFGITYGFIVLGFLYRIIVDSFRLHMKN